MFGFWALGEYALGESGYGLAVSANLVASEAPDTANVQTVATTIVTTEVTEAPDTLAAAVAAFAEVYVVSTELPDTANFQTSGQTSFQIETTEAPDLMSVATEVIAYSALDVSEEADTASAVIFRFDTEFDLVAVEAPDTMSANVLSRTITTFGVTEAQDVAAFSTTATTTATFGISEAPDTISVDVELRAWIEFAISELPDTMRVRSFVADFFTYGGDFICVAGEDRFLYAPPEDRHMVALPTSITPVIPPEYRQLTVGPRKGEC